MEITKALNLRDLYRMPINGIALGEVELPSGAGSFAAHQLCVMQVVNVAMFGVSRFKSEGPGDNPSSVPGAIRGLAIAMNDALAEGPRQRLKEYTIRIARTAGVNDPGGLREERVNTLVGAEWSSDLGKHQPLKAYELLDRCLAVYEQ